MTSTMSCASFAPATHKTAHVGKQRDFHTIPWPTWHDSYAPRVVRCLTYKLQDDNNTANKVLTMLDVKEREFRKDGYFVGSVSEHISKGNKLIILDWTFDQSFREDPPGNSFLQEVLPIDKSQKFQDGIVAIGLGRWMKTLLLMMVASSTSARPQIAQWFRSLVQFVAKLAAAPEAKNWFDVARETIRHNDKVEDILVMKLLQAILREKTTRAREFRWFEVSMHRALKYSTHRQFRDNVLVMVVWLYTDALLVKGMRDQAALDFVFQQLTTLTSSADADILRILFKALFPPLVAHVDTICTAIRAGKPWVPDTSALRFADNSEIRPAVAQPESGIGLGVSGGILTDRTAAAVAGNGNATTVKWYDVSTMEYNNFTVLHVPRPTTECVLTLCATPMPSDLTSKHGANVVFRGHTIAPKNGKAFAGVMGLSLAGGRGDGKSAPTVERSKPSVLTGSSNAGSVLCTVRLTPTEYQVLNREWSAPLTCAFQPSDKVFAVYFKGFKDVHMGVDVAPPRAAPVTRPALAAMPAALPLESSEGISFAEMMAQTPLQALQRRVDGLR